MASDNRLPDEYDETIRSDDHAEVERLVPVPPDEGATIPAPAADGADAYRPAPDEGATIAGGTDYRARGNSNDSQISRKFEDIIEIGRGGMGIVYLARDRRLGRLVALKCLKSDTTENKQSIKRFRLEARTIASLEHFNIVRIYNLIEEEDFLWIVMEFVGGGSLQDWLAREGALPVERVVDIGKQLCAALSIAHEKGIIHRDIKPANILLTKRGSPKLADFGLARDTNSNTMLTTTGVMMGTMYYASPEQLVSGKHVDQRSDIYSLGATLYALCTGKSPHIMRLDAVPAEIREVLTKCLEESPDNRYADVDEVTAALNESMSGRYSSAATTSEVGCPECGHENPVDVRFCQKCGSDLSSLFRKCPECGKESRIDIDYCGSCGTKIAAQIVARKNEPVEPLYRGDYRTIELGDGMKMELVLINPLEVAPDGFLMGSPEHEVFLTKPYWLGVTPVTQAQYRAVMGKNPSSFKEVERGFLGIGGKYHDRTNHPVELISWNGADSFCKELSGRQSGMTFRLPSEAQWEFACRAGSTSRYCFGDQEGQLSDYAWYVGNSNSMTHPVAAKRPNAWGLYDMHGNVWEWCADWYYENYYQNSPLCDPHGPNNGSFRVVRGGSWYSTPWYCRSANRSGNSPGSSSSSLGFRVAMDLP